MCTFVEMTINEGTDNETVVVTQNDCNNPDCPSSDASR